MQQWTLAAHYPGVMVSFNGSVVEGRPLRNNQGGWVMQEPNCLDEVVGIGVLVNRREIFVLFHKMLLA